MTGDLIPKALLPVAGEPIVFRLDQPAIDALWSERAKDEWPAVDGQQDGADLVLAPAADHP
jgi:hypothetical protein